MACRPVTRDGSCRPDATRAVGRAGCQNLKRASQPGSTALGRLARARRREKVDCTWQRQHGPGRLCALGRIPDLVANLGHEMVHIEARGREVLQ